MYFIDEEGRLQFDDYNGHLSFQRSCNFYPLLNVQLVIEPHLNSLISSHLFIARQIRFISLANEPRCFLPKNKNLR